MALPNNPQTRKEMYLSNMAGQGTALPSEPHTREEEYLDYIAKNGGGGGGTTVVANPSGTATDELTKIQIGQTIYDIEGGSGAEYTKELIYDSGSETTFAPISSNATAFDVDVNFSKSVSNYDILEIWVNDEASGGISANVLPIYVDLETALAKVIDINGWDRRYVRFKIKTATTFAYFGTNPGGQGDVPRIFKIYGIKFGGGGGGTGDGDMKKSVYDGDLDVAGAGGIKSYVTGAISGKVDKVQGKGLSTNDYDDSAKAIVDGVTTALDAKQPKTLSEPIYVDGVAKFSVETAIDAVNDLAASNKSALLTKADTSQIAAIQDGQNIDSFGDVETALATKVDKVTGKGLSTNDYDNTEKAKVAGAFPRSEQAVLGAKNIMPYPYASVPNENNGIAWTENEGKVTGSGIATGNSSFTLTSFGYIPNKNVGMKLTGCPAGGSFNGYRILVDYSNDGTTWAKSSGDIGEGCIIENYPYISIKIYIPNGTDFSTPKTFEPMISFDGGEYVPPVMTNKELTNAVAVKNDATQITSDNMTIEYCIIAKAGKIRACTIKATANANITAMATIFKGFPDALLEAIDCQTSAEFVNASDNSLYPVIGRSVSGNFEVSTKNAIASGVTIRGTIIYVAK